MGERVAEGVLVASRGYRGINDLLKCTGETKGKVKLIAPWSQLPAVLQTKDDRTTDGDPRALLAPAQARLHCSILNRATVTATFGALDAYLLGHTSMLASVSLRKGSRKPTTGLAVRRPPRAGPKSSVNLI